MSIYDSLASPSSASTGSPTSTIYDSLIQKAPVAPTLPAPNYTQIPGGAKTIYSDLLTTAKGAFSSAPSQDLFTAPHSAPMDTVTKFAQSLNDAGHQIFSGIGDLFGAHQSALSRGVGAAQAGIGAINAAFAPINSVITYARHVPGLGTLATGLNALFGAIGTGGADTAEGAINALPISQGAKDQITPIAKQAGALVAQIYTGKVGGDVFTELADHTKTILHTMSTEIAGAKAAATTELPSKIPVQGESTQASVPVTPYASTGEPLSSFQLGPKSPTALPTAETSPTATPAPPGLRYEPIASVPTVPESAPARTTQTLKPIEGTGELKTRGVASSIEASAIEKGLTDTFGDLPEYQSVNFKDQARMVSDLITKDPGGARAIAMGDKAAPKGVVPEMVAVGVEKAAHEAGDVQTLRDLANSKLTTAATTMGQRIAAYGQRDSASPVDAIKEVQDARQAALEAKGTDLAKATDSTIKNIKSEVAKVRSARPAWEDFVKQITCGI